MTSTAYDGHLAFRVRGGRWAKTQRPPLSLTVLDRPDHLLVLPSDQSGGLRGGDRVLTEVEVDHGAVEWRPPTSSLYFPSRDRQGDCSVAVALSVGAGGRLAWVPPVSLPCTGARVTQTVRLEAARDAELLYWDGWAAGRVASGELWRFARLHNDLTLSVAGRVVFRERWTLAGDDPGPLDPAGFGGACQWHLGLAVGPRSSTDLAARVDRARAAGALAEVGVVDDGVLLARVLVGTPIVL